MPKPTFFKLPKDKQELIMNVSTKEFSESTFNEVKISSIINKSQIPRSSFYDYFEDKKDLYRYIITLMKEEKMKFMGPVYEKAQTSFFETLTELLNAGAEFALTHPEYEKISGKVYENMEIVMEIFGEENLDVSKNYEDMLVCGIKAGEIRADIDVSFVAKSIYILSSNLMIEGLKDKNTSINKLIKEISDKMIDFIRNGIAR